MHIFIGLTQVVCSIPHLCSFSSAEKITAVEFSSWSRNLRTSFGKAASHRYLSASNKGRAPISAMSTYFRGLCGDVFNISSPYFNKTLDIDFGLIAEGIPKILITYVYTNTIMHWKRLIYERFPPNWKNVLCRETKTNFRSAKRRCTRTQQVCLSENILLEIFILIALDIWG